VRCFFCATCGEPVGSSQQLELTGTEVVESFLVIRLATMLDWHQAEVSVNAVLPVAVVATSKMRANKHEG